MVEKKKSGNGLLKTIKNTLSRGKLTSVPAEPVKPTKKKPEVVDGFQRHHFIALPFA